MLLNSEGKAVHVDTKKMSPKAREIVLSGLTEVLGSPSYRDAPKGFFSIGARARMK